VKRATANKPAGNAFAMQCAGTVAFVYRETKDWRWPVAQFACMTVFGLRGKLHYLSFVEIILHRRYLRLC
jgi:Fe2+ transport system protein B